MTINDHHIIVAQSAESECKKIRDMVLEASEILQKNAGPRNDIYAHQIGALAAETMRALIKAQCHAEMLLSVVKQARNKKQ